MWCLSVCLSKHCVTSGSSSSEGVTMVCLFKLCLTSDSSSSDGVTVVVLEAAVLLEAGWDHSVHEVWTTFVPRDEVSTWFFILHTP